MTEFSQPQTVIEGVSLNLGVACGQAYIYDPEYAEDESLLAPKKEQIFLNAVEKSIGLCITNQTVDHTKNLEFISVQKELLQDPSWQQRVIAKINLGSSINKALIQVLEELGVTLGSDAFWAARLQEIKGITQLVLQCLSNAQSTIDKTKPTVLCAKTISPLEIMQFEQANLVALVVEDNSFLSHGMIIARSKKIPVVGGITGLKKLINNNDQLLIDGDLGRIFVRPVSTTLSDYNISKKNQLEIPPGKSTVISRDGIKVHLAINANISEDLGYLKRATIDGVGLYRTEIPFMMSESWPDVETQTRLYLQVMNTAKEKFVIFRALDIGGDKILQSVSKNFKATQKSWGGSRFTMQRPSLIRLQLRAMIRARAYCDYPSEPLHVMFPMITDTEEMLFVRSLVKKELEREKGLGHKVPTTIKVGAMIEVPSIVFQLSQFLDLVDFISIGSNDLFQFFFAIDRENAVMSKRYDILSRSFMQMLKAILNQAKAKDIPVSLCGEMASNPLEAMALLGIGLRHFSINPSAVTTIENMIQSLDIWSVQDCMNNCLSDSPFANKIANSSIRERMLSLAEIQETLLA